tara:strand:+ start:5754 stop:8366 length:2613 start_codon:yes stop_codon:yes gene_type:complete
MYEIILGRKEADRKKYGTTGTIFLGKHYVKMGQRTALSNEVLMDVTTSHAVLVVGKRGSGKCLHGDTIITLEDGSQIPIKCLENHRKRVMSLNQNLQMEKTSRSEFFKRTVTKLLKIKLRSGKEIKLTPEHPLMTVKGWMPAEKLHLGSRIATPRVIDAFGTEIFSEEKVKILAYLIAEGHLSNNFVLFSNMDQKIIDDFKNAIHNFDSNLKIKLHSKEGCFRIVENRKGEIVIPSLRDAKGKFITKPLIDKQSSIRKWLEELNMYGKLAHERSIPDIIFSLSKQQIALFLNRLFSCDGCIYEKQKNYWQISYGSSSKKLIRQVQHLLLKFEIPSRIREKITKKRLAYEATIDGAHVYTFLNEIGFFGQKEIRAKKAIKECPQITRNTNVDTIPKEIWDLYKPDNWAEVGRKLNYAHPKALRESQRYSPSRQKLLQIAKADESELIEKFATSDIFWDEITSLQLEEGNFTVYDICVPENHNFVANDIIVHNSYTLGVMAEGMANLPPEIAQNIAVVILDTMGIYWTMKYPNDKEPKLLKEWQLQAKALDTQIYTPEGHYKEFKEKGIPTDFPFSLNVAELDAADWCLTFAVSLSEPIGVLIERTISDLQDKDTPYDIDDIIIAMKNNPEANKDVRNAAINRFLSVKGWGLFSTKGTSISELVKGGQVTILDVSVYATIPGAENVKALVIGLVSQKLFVERMIARKQEEFEEIHHREEAAFEDQKTQKDNPLVWLIIDEAHEFLPRDYTVASSRALITILREGRQPGISLILATQQPGKVHTDVITQSDIVVSHRLTAKIDIDALGAVMQSYMRQGLDKELNLLPRVTGAGVVFDDTNEKLYPFRTRPRFTWHGGSAPTAIPPEDENEITL